MYRTICRQYLIENDFCLKFDFIQKTWNIMHILNGEIFMELIIRGNLFDFFSKKKHNQPYVILIKCIEIEWSISLKGSHLLLACKKALIGSINRFLETDCYIEWIVDVFESQTKAIWMFTPSEWYNIYAIVKMI